MIKTIFIALLALCSVARADFTEVDRQALVNKNLIKNAGFEQGKAYWTASGGTFTTDTTAANVGSGNAAGSWDPSAASQTLVSNAVPVPPGQYGQNGYARCSVKTTSTDVVMQAYDGTNVLNSVTISGNGSYQGFGINFQMPSSGNVQIRFLSASNSAVMYIDDCYLGAALNISAVSQIDDWTSYSLSFTGSTSNPTFGTVTTNIAQHRRVGDSEAIRFNWKETTAGTAGSGTYLFSIPSGLTIDTSKVPADTSGNLGSVGFAGLTAFDGTNTYVAECSMFVYDTTHLAAICSNDTTNTTGRGAGIWGSSYISLAIQQAAISFTALVPISGRTANSTITPAVTSKSWQGRITGCTGTNTYASTSYGDFPAQTGCTNTDDVNDGFGTVTAAATGFGPTWTPQSNGTYKVCSTSTMAVASTDMEARIVSSDGKVIDETAPTSPGVSGGFLIHSLCGLYKVSAAGTPVTFKWQAKSLAGAQVQFRQDLVVWSIVNVTTSLPNAILTMMPKSEIFYDTVSAFGSSSTNVYKFTNLQSNTGTAFTDSTSATLGTSVTINENGLYCLSASIEGPATTGSSQVVISKNASGTDLTTTDPRTLAYPKRLTFSRSGATGTISVNTAATCTLLVPGDVIRVHGDGDLPGTAYNAQLRITKMAQ